MTVGYYDTECSISLAVGKLDPSYASQSGLAFTARRTKGWAEKLVANVQI
jgi:hypothetical protein